MVSQTELPDLPLNMSLIMSWIIIYVYVDAGQPMSQENLMKNFIRTKNQDQGLKKI